MRTSGLRHTMAGIKLSGTSSRTYNPEGTHRDSWVDIPDLHAMCGRHGDEAGANQSFVWTTPCPHGQGVPRVTFSWGILRWRGVWWWLISVWGCGWDAGMGACQSFHEFLHWRRHTGLRFHTTFLVSFSKTPVSLTSGKNNPQGKK